MAAPSGLDLSPREMAEVAAVTVASGQEFTVRRSEAVKMVPRQVSMSQKAPEE